MRHVAELRWDIRQPGGGTAATHELVRGRQAEFFWLGAGLVAAGLLAPLIGPAAGAATLLGLLAHEHAYVQAGQSVPLA